MRVVYNVLWWLLLPLLPLRLWWRGRREPGYRMNVGERFGFYGDAKTLRGAVGIHAVGLGEARAIAPLVERLQREAPARPILLTHMTATGREAGRALFGERVMQAWLPYDIPFAVRGFLRHFKPCAGVLVETELWPNLVMECARQCIAIFLVNARMSKHSAAGYARIDTISRAMLDAF